MLKLKDLEKYKKKSQNEVDPKYMKDDDNYILNSHRPIKDEKINELPTEDLHKFVDDVLRSKSINKIMYSSNSKAEINLLIKSTEFTKSSLGNLKKSNFHTNDPIDIVKIRNKKETIAQINEEINNNKLEKIQEKEFLEKKINDFHKRMRSEMKSKMKIEKSDQIVSKDRKKKFDKTFSFIKKKLIICDNEEKKKKLLPDMKLKMANVYSRLYHNVVLCKIEEEKQEKTNSSNAQHCRLASNVPHSMDLEPQSKTSHKKLSVKNIFNSWNGKEFTVKITEEMIAECFYRHSGGPLITTDNKKVKLLLFILLCSA
jgi:hypothetical protein